MVGVKEADDAVDESPAPAVRVAAVPTAVPAEVHTLVPVGWVALGPQTEKETVPVGAPLVELPVTTALSELLWPRTMVECAGVVTVVVVVPGATTTKHSPDDWSEDPWYGDPGVVVVVVVEPSEESSESSVPHEVVPDDVVPVEVDVPLPQPNRFVRLPDGQPQVLPEDDPEPQVLPVDVPEPSEENPQVPLVEELLESPVSLQSSSPDELPLPELLDVVDFVGA